MPIFAKILRHLFLPLIFFWILAFAVYNHDLVALNLWPLPYEMSAPLSVWMVAVLGFGYCMGLSGGYGKYWNAQRQNRAMKKQLEMLHKNTLQN